MDSPTLIAQEQKQELLSLIVDKKNILGTAIAEKLQANATVVLVSEAVPDPGSSIIHIPYTHTVPKIPEGKYQYVFFVLSDETKELLDPLVKKAQEDKSTMLLVMQREDPLVEKMSAQRSSVTTVILGDLFDTPEKNSALDTWLKQTKKTKKIVLSSMGLHVVYPVRYTDALEGLFSAAFSREKGSYLLCSKHPYTQLALSHTLQKVDPFITVDFQGEGEKEVDLPSGTYILHENYPVLEYLRTAYNNLVVEEQVTKEEKVVLLKPLGKLHPSKKKNHSLPAFLVYLLLVFLLTPPLSAAGFGLLGKTFLQSSISDLEQGKVHEAYQKAFAAEQSLRLASAAFDLLGGEVGMVGKGSLVTPFASQLQGGQTAASTLSSGIAGVEKLQGVFVGTSLRPKEDITEGVNLAKDALVTLQKIDKASLPTSYQSRIRKYNSLVKLLEETADVLPSMLVGEKEYVVLFQNNMELRPGGGFIGSYATVRVSNGKIKDFAIHDVYDADGQLKGHVEPPFAIRRYIPIPHLYLRDSNFDVDFVKNSGQAAFLLNQEVGDKPDGVIAVDLSLVKGLIGALGSVYVPSYNQTVTRDNFFLLTEQHSEKNFFPGSSQKKDFLNVLFTSLQAKFAEKKGISYQSVLDALISGVQEKHVLFAFADPTIQAPFTVNGFSSSLWDDRKDDPTTIQDFFGINEANVGGNKVNYFVNRSISQKILVNDKGEVNESVAVTYKNTSTGEWPGGDYKNYVRFILPQGTVLNEVGINGVVQKIIPAITDSKVYEGKGFVAPNGLEVEKTEEGGKVIYGFFLTVPQSSTATITLSYTLADKLVDNAVANYNLKLFKQPGMDTLDYALEVAYPQSFGLLSASNNINNTNGVVSFVQPITSDTLLRLNFAKK